MSKNYKIGFNITAQIPDLLKSFFEKLVREVPNQPWARTVVMRKYRMHMTVEIGDLIYSS